LSRNSVNANGFAIDIAPYEIVASYDGTVSGNEAILGVSGNGIVCDRCNNVEFIRNDVSGFSNGPTGYGFHIAVSSNMMPTANNNTFTGNIVRFPPRGSGKGFWEQCNVPQASCQKNIYKENSILSDGTPGSIGFLLESDSGTVANDVIGPNTINGPAIGISIGRGVINTLLVPGVINSAKPVMDMGRNTINNTGGR
jgi:hypothetical protein